MKAGLHKMNEQRWSVWHVAASIQYANPKAPMCNILLEGILWNRIRASTLQTYFWFWYLDGFIQSMADELKISFDLIWFRMDVGESPAKSLEERWHTFFFLYIRDYMIAAIFGTWISIFEFYWHTGKHIERVALLITLFPKPLGWA